MPEIIVHLPDGALLHLPEGTEPAQILASVRKYGDQQAAGAQQHTLEEGSLGKTVSDAASGLVHSPIDLLHGLLHSAASIDKIRTGEAFPHSLAEVGDDIKSGVSAAAHGLASVDKIRTGAAIPMSLDEAGADLKGSRFSDPYTGGSMLGQLLLGELIPRGLSAARSALPEASTVGKGVESASRIIPKKILGTDVPMVREGVESFGKHLQSPEVNVPGYEQYGPASKSSYQSEAPSMSALGKVPYGDADAASGEALSRARVEQETARGQYASPEDMARIPHEGAFSTDGKSLNINQQYLRPSVKALDETSAPTPDSVRRPSTAEQDNIDSHSSFGEGHVLPEALPTELRDAANDGLNFPSRGIYDVQSGKVEPFIKGLEAPVAPEADHQFTDFSNGVDEIVNQAGPEDLASSSPTGLGRSRLTNSWKDWINKRGQSTPGWPFKELPQ